MTENNLYIANDFDRPAANMVCLLEAHTLRYLSPRLLGESVEYDADQATRLEDFGFTIKGLYIDGKAAYSCRETGPSRAQYRDGKPRRWQGLTSFVVMLESEETP